MPCQHEPTFPMPSAIYSRRAYVEADTLRHSTEDVTNVAKGFRPKRGRLPSAGPTQPFGEAIDQLAVVWRKLLEKTVDGFDDDAPLRESGHGTERVQAHFEFERHPNAQLRVVLDLLSFFRAGWWPAYATAFRRSIVGHSPRRWRRMAEIRRLRYVSDTCGLRRLTPATTSTFDRCKDRSIGPDSHPFSDV